MDELLEDLIAKQEIVAVAIRYATALDNKDWPLLRSVFAPTGVLIAGPIGNVIGPEEIGRAVSKVLDGQTTHHFNGNHDVILNGTSATHTCYLIAHHVRESMSTDNWYTFAGSYHDEMIKTAEGWRISQRRLVPIWTLGNPLAHSPVR